MDDENEKSAADATSKSSENNAEQIELTTKEAYFASLNTWVKNANVSQNAMALFPWYLMNNYPQMFQNPNYPPTSVQPNVINPNAAPEGRLGMVILDDQAQVDIINRNGGYEMVIAPFWKRALAEAIDIVILLIFKVVVTFILINIFDMNLGFDVNSDTLRKALDNDFQTFLTMSMDLIAFSHDLLMLEIVTKIIVCFNEAIWTSLYNGSTPGKHIMNLRILYVEAVHPLIPIQQAPGPFQAAGRIEYRALLYPAQTPTFQRSLMRAIAKNVIMALLFPVCFLMIFFKNNRTVYDILTKTVVVEADPNPVLRRL